MLTARLPGSFGGNTPASHFSGSGGDAHEATADSAQYFPTFSVQQDEIIAESDLVKDVLFLLEGSSATTKYFGSVGEDNDYQVSSDLNIRRRFRLATLTADTVELYLKSVFIKFAKLTRQIDSFVLLSQGCDCPFGASYRALALALSTFLFHYRRKLQKISMASVESNVCLFELEKLLSSDFQQIQFIHNALQMCILPINELPYLAPEGFKFDAPDFSNADRASFLLSNLFGIVEKCSIGDAKHFRVALWLFNCSLRPILTSIDIWLQQCRLDPTGEFFISGDLQVTVFSEGFWSSKYRLKEDVIVGSVTMSSVPSFLKEIAGDILVAGKSVELVHHMQQHIHRSESVRAAAQEESARLVRSLTNYSLWDQYILNMSKFFGQVGVPGESHVQPPAPPLFFSAAEEAPLSERLELPVAGVLELDASIAPRSDPAVLPSTYMSSAPAAVVVSPPGKLESSIAIESTPFPPKAEVVAAAPLFEIVSEPHKAPPAQDLPYIPLISEDPAAKDSAFFHEIDVLGTIEEEGHAISLASRSATDIQAMYFGSACANQPAVSIPSNSSHTFDPSKVITSGTSVWSLIRNCIVEPVRAQCKAVSTSVMRIFLRSCSLCEHLAAARSFYTQEHGLLFQTFKQTLHRDLRGDRGSSSERAKRYGAAGLNMLFQQCLNLSGGQTSFYGSELVSLHIAPSLPKGSPNDSALEEEDDATSLVRSIYDTDRIQLHYAVEWPLNFFLNKSTILEYNKIFSFLMRISRAEFELQRLIIGFSAESRRQKHFDGSTAAAIHRMQVLRMRLLHFVQTIRYYVASRVLQTAWVGFEEKLVAAMDLEQMLSIHKEFLSKLMDRCMLSTQFAAIRQRIDAILDLALLFGSTFDVDAILKAHNDKHSTASLIQSYNTIDLELSKSVTFLINVLSAVAEQNHVPHLEEFLLRLDFNGYWAAHKYKAP